jgi:hypothetical protein
MDVSLDLEEKYYEKVVLELRGKEHTIGVWSFCEKYHQIVFQMNEKASRRRPSKNG